VTANCEAVELFVNGKSLGQGKQSNRYVCFSKRGVGAGEIKAMGYISGKAVTAQTLRTAVLRWS